MAWIKADTKAILAIQEHVITNNARLSVTHSDYNTWTLNIRGVRREDQGIYMCQVNTNPMKSQVSKDHPSQWRAHNKKGGVREKKERDRGKMKREGKEGRETTYPEKWRIFLP